MTQSEALTILKTGANVFLTGEPGAGKTHTVNAYVKYLRFQGIEPAICASTGIAATHIGGMTIHSWSGIGIRNKLDQYELDKIASNEYVARRIGKTKVLIIDEVSMLGPETLSMVEAVCREVKRANEPFGGLQVVLVGDFFQLPPIVKNNFQNKNVDEFNQDSFFEQEEVGLFAYQSQAWKKMSPIVCYLTEQHRQDDYIFLDILSAIRSDSINIDHVNKINERQVQRGSVHDNVTRLFSHNADVDKLNNQALARINSDESVHKMNSSGKDALVSVLIKGCLSPENLALKRGAVVMFTKNNIKDGFVNGTLGEVIDFDSTTRYPIVRTNSGKIIKVEPVDWVVEENGKIKAQITQIPLRLAWAITVHKSQGMSLDSAVMDLSQVFEYGQGYVALSRVRRLSGLHILGINERALKVHPQILDQDRNFHTESENANIAFGKIKPEDILKMQKNFVLACGGVWRDQTLDTKPGESEKTSFQKLREKHPKAYARWNDTEEKELIKLFKEGKTKKEIAQILQRKIGGIHSRLVKLGLIEEE
jgi:ATP-dependent DNA helicase PIF1